MSMCGKDEKMTQLYKQCMDLITPGSTIMGEFKRLEVQIDNNMPTIVHFEIPADDVERSKKFYGDLFGWKIEKWPGSTVDDKE